MKTRFVAWFGLLGMVWLAGCNVETKTGSNGTGLTPPPEQTVASGPVDGLGPLGVGGASLTDASAEVLRNTSPGRGAADLRLGMLADAAGTALASTATGQAVSVVTQSRIVGPVTAVNLPDGRITVLNQAAQIDLNTIFDGFASLAAAPIGAILEVHGLALPGSGDAGGVLATRLILRPDLPAGSVELFGNVAEPGAGRLVMQGVPVVLTNAQFVTASPAGIVSAPGIAALPSGSVARAVGTYDANTGIVTANLVASGFALPRTDEALVFIEGIVRTAAGPTLLTVGDFTVDTSAATGEASPVGARVKVRGRWQRDRVRATTVEVIAPGTRIDYVVEGVVEAFESLAAFRVRGELIDASQAQITGGTGASVADGRRVRVRAHAGAGRLSAREITLIN